MLYRIPSITDPLAQLISDDPVRPELPIDFRINDTSDMFVLLDPYSRPQAAICARYKDSIPASVSELAFTNMLDPNTAVFYTIWSYQPGAGRQLIQAVRQWIETNKPTVTNFVTLSPPTEMARVFHLRNGADVYRVNADTVNYRYL